MSKHKLTVCCGTTCYLACGDRFDYIEDIIHSRFGELIEVVPTACLGQCKKVGNEAKPPFAKFDDIIIEEATNENIINKIIKFSIH